MSYSRFYGSYRKFWEVLDVGKMERSEKENDGGKCVGPRALLKRRLYDTQITGKHK